MLEGAFMGISKASIFRQSGIFRLTTKFVQVFRVALLLRKVMLFAPDLERPQEFHVEP